MPVTRSVKQLPDTGGRTVPASVGSRGRGIHADGWVARGAGKPLAGPLPAVGGGDWAVAGCTA